MNCFYCDNNAENIHNLFYMECEGIGGEAFYPKRFDTICHPCWLVLGYGECKDRVSAPKGRSWIKGKPNYQDTEPKATHP